MKIKRYLLISVMVLSTALTLAGMSSAPAKALEEPAELTSVIAQVFPEYDDLVGLNSPSLLVMLHGQVGGVTVPSTASPATIRFLVPAAAIMSSAGSLDATGTYVYDKDKNPPYDRNASADLPGWDEVSYKITNSTFVMEYYDPSIIKGYPDKTIDYEFRTLYPITDLQIFIQEPLTSTNYSIIPASDAFTSTDNYSGKQFKFHQYNRSNLLAGDLLSFNIAYTKSDPLPSILPSNNGSTASTDSGSTGTIVWIILGALVLIAVGVYFALRINSNRRNSRRNDRRARMGKSKKKRLLAGFCGQCRQPLDSSDVFCPNCGAKRI